MAHWERPQAIGCVRMNAPRRNRIAFRSAAKFLAMCSNAYRPPIRTSTFGLPSWSTAFVNRSVIWPSRLIWDLPPGCRITSDYQPGKALQHDRPYAISQLGLSLLQLDAHLRAWDSAQIIRAQWRIEQVRDQDDAAKQDEEQPAGCQHCNPDSALARHGPLLQESASMLTLVARMSDTPADGRRATGTVRSNGCRRRLRTPVNLWKQTRLATCQWYRRNSQCLNADACSTRKLLLVRYARLYQWP